MEAKILLGRILQRLIDEGYSRSVNKRFGFIRFTKSVVWVSREDGEETPISFKKIITAIEAYQRDLRLYEKGPSALRDHDITHVNSPIFSLLHLLKKSDYGDT